jgi:hypothetical protein
MQKHLLDSILSYLDVIDVVRLMDATHHVIQARCIADGQRWTSVVPSGMTSDETNHFIQLISNSSSLKEINIQNLNSHEISVILPCNSSWLPPWTQITVICSPIMDSMVTIELMRLFICGAMVRTTDDNDVYVNLTDFLAMFEFE